ncbi:hypothetical protein GMORB2_0240 [Geosmithia morbida]|uniref:R3H-associated N-terminal domain-containing protein n=1 Tax=Geosmithia morbida TaxID=1094350 RepID=A0A9P4Z312_9HYPO|nr:uncharacterized protein GMORB2_0240 [Geosmithia morbida]KAF4126504.1 hypothetical protein GMORB2_0240 [Geosmithia morbida]
MTITYLPQCKAQNRSATGIDIDAWTISALQSLSISPVAGGTGTPLAIPIDNEAATTTTVGVSFGNDAKVAVRTDVPRRPPSRRDSLKRREALLKGNEGSRQRRRWENDRLLHVPNAQPPQPSDWEVHPTHTVHHVPYQLAQFWDLGLRQTIDKKTAKLATQRKRQQLAAGSATGLGCGEVPRDLREATKRSSVVTTWVRALEDPVREYILKGRTGIISQPMSVEAADPVSSDEMDSEDEEIVFVGRRSAGLPPKPAASQASGWRLAHREVGDETVDHGMVFDSFGDHESAPFKRWLTHSISDYYGLESTSVIVPNPSRKVVYVKFKKGDIRQGSSKKQFPRPLWEICHA